MNQINQNIVRKGFKHSDLSSVSFYSVVNVKNENGETVPVMRRGVGASIDLGNPEDYQLKNLVRAGIPLKEISDVFFKPHSVEAENMRVMKALNQYSNIQLTINNQKSE